VEERASRKLSFFHPWSPREERCCVPRRGFSREECEWNEGVWTVARWNAKALVVEGAARSSNAMDFVPGSKIILTVAIGLDGDS